MFEEIEKRTDLTMVEKAELSKEKFKESYKDYNLYSLIDLVIKKQIKYESNEKAEDLEFIAIKELIDEKSSEANLVDLNMAINSIGIVIDFNKNEIKDSSKKLLDDEAFEKLTKSLSNQGLNYSRIFVRYHENLASQDERILVEDINRKLRIKERNTENDLLKEYQIKLQECANKKRIKL